MERNWKPEIDLHKYVQLIVDKSGKQFKWRKIQLAFSIQMVFF